jgi:hypothetical protein
MQGQFGPETPPWFDAIPRSKCGSPKRSEEENPRVQAVGATADMIRISKSMNQ